MQEKTINDIIYAQIQAAALLTPYVEIHKGLFPKCTLQSQIIKFEEEFQEYLDAETQEKAIKELGDCLIVICGIMRFAPLLAACLANEIFGIAFEIYGKTPSDMMYHVDRKFTINLGRTWRFDEKLQTYKHVGVDGNE